MIEIPQMCKQCKKALFQLAVKDGGLVFCSHLGNSSQSGLFVAATPVDGGGCKLHITYPCTESAARKKADLILRGLHGSAMPKV